MEVGGVLLLSPARLSRGKVTSCANRLRGWLGRPTGFKNQEKHSFFPESKHNSSVVHRAEMLFCKSSNIILQILSPFVKYRESSKVSKILSGLCPPTEFSEPVVPAYPVLCSDCAVLSNSVSCLRLPIQLFLNQTILRSF